MRALKLLSILSLTGMAALCMFSWFSGDDLCYRTELSRYSVIKKAWLQYMHWDGRSLGIASLLQLACLKYLPAQVISLLSLTVFIAIAVMIIIVVKTENNQSNIQVTWISTALLASVLWLGMWKLIPDILYWPTGTWYTTMCLIAMLWLYLFQFDLHKKNFNPKRIFTMFMISFFCGNNSHNLVTALILIACIELAYALLILKEKKAVKYILAVLAGLMTGALIVMLAPGNQERLKAIYWPGFSISFLYYCLMVLAKYTYWLLSLFVLLVMLLWLHGFRKSAGEVLTAIRIKNFASLTVIIHSHKYLLAALSTIVVFSATSFFAVPRTATFFAVFITLYVIQKSNINLGNSLSLRFKKGSIAYLIIFICMIGYEMIQVSALRKKIAHREEYFNNNKGKDGVVTEIKAAEIPFAFEFVDITPDTAHWVNRCVALNYGLKTVRTLPD